ncbi:hypothetical protein GcM3_197026 [Golovinomyces cichoracearum]|uniref:Uncharacterized protein n=1 Tax=Golovinomyces cichoracearum TaxID=62708 RepID=A0A420HFI9_9PEZI|nr:hypothetical protein GcM3_197026 [Golovinomyces cichoracearum]
MANQSALFAGNMIAGPLIIQTRKENSTVENEKKKANRQYDQYLAEGCVNDQPEKLSDSEIEALINTTDLDEAKDYQEDLQETYFGQNDGKELFHAIADLSV